MEAALRELGFEPATAPTDVDAYDDEEELADPAVLTFEQEMEKMFGADSAPAAAAARVETRTPARALRMVPKKPQADDEEQQGSSAPNFRITPKSISELANGKAPHLVRELDVSCRQLKRLENLETCTNLIKLDLSCNNIAVVEGLEGLPALRELYLYSNKLRRLGGLEAMTDLQKLCVQDNLLVSLEGLLVARKLVALDVSKNHLDVIDGLDNCKLLTKLNASCNRLTSVQGMMHLNKLEDLDLHQNRLRVLPKNFYHYFRDLRYLSLSYNQLEDVSSLHNMRLFSLALSHNKLDLSTLPPLATLRELHIAGNRLTDVSTVVPLYPHLEVLDVRDNMISRVEGVLALSSMPLFSLSVSGNPCCARVELDPNASWLDRLPSSIPSLRVLDGRDVSKRTVNGSSVATGTLTDDAQMRQIEEVVDEVVGTMGLYEVRIDDMFASLATQFGEMDPQNEYVLASTSLVDPLDVNAFNGAATSFGVEDPDDPPPPPPPPPPSGNGGRRSATDNPRPPSVRGPTTNRRRPTSSERRGGRPLSSGEGAPTRTTRIVPPHQPGSVVPGRGQHTVISAPPSARRSSKANRARAAKRSTVKQAESAAAEAAVRRRAVENTTATATKRRAVENASATRRRAAGSARATAAAPRRAPASDSGADAGGEFRRPRPVRVPSARSTRSEGGGRTPRREAAARPVSSRERRVFGGSPGARLHTPSSNGARSSVMDEEIQLWDDDVVSLASGDGGVVVASEGGMGGRPSSARKRLMDAKQFSQTAYGRR